MIRRALENDKLVHEAPATVGRLAESALTFAAVKESL